MVEDEGHQAERHGGVTGFEVVPYALPFREPYTTARGTLKRREMVLLRVHTSEGIVGLGEAVPLSLRGGRPLEYIVDELRRLRGAFAEASNKERSELLTRAFFQLSAPSRCALFTAWDDMAGKAQDIPAWKLQGAHESVPLPCNATLTAGAPEDVSQQALRWAGDGFSTFKLKLGLADDVEQVTAVREAVGPESKLRVDANGVWGPSEATSKLNEMAGLEIELAEQPCASLAELAEVRRNSEVPIVADESIATREEAERAIELGACDFATLKLSKVGGPGYARSIGSAVSSYMSSALDGPVGIAAAAHTAQALYPTLANEGYDEHFKGGRNPGLAHGLATQRLFAETIATCECELRDGFLHIPDGPGLGVEIDDAALERHRL
jgi:L-alanine-DL-glutamate epimerase-like enolase superfamily enzyme